MVEVQDIFIKYGSEYRKNHKLTLVQHNAMSSIEKCRTSQLGGHKDVCENCGNVQISYNSCRNRHCPKCQTLAKERWVDNQKYNLLNIGYFHVVFTIPDTLNLIVYQNQRELYTLLFKTVAETLSELTDDKKYLGRYTHRIAISNNRIISMEKGKVTFKWRDYKDASKWKLMTLSADEFIRRFLIHVLPNRFMKIRHYGLLGNRNKNTKLKICKKLTNTPILPKENISTIELIQKITGRDLSKCPHCGYVTSKGLFAVNLPLAPSKLHNIKNMPCYGEGEVISLLIYLVLFIHVYH